MTGEPADAASKKSMAPELMFLPERTPQLSIIISDLKVKWSLHFTFNVVPVTQYYKRRRLKKHLCNQSRHHKKYGQFACPDYQLLT